MQHARSNLDIYAKSIEFLLPVVDPVLVRGATLVLFGLIFFLSFFFEFISKVILEVFGWLVNLSPKITRLKSRGAFILILKTFNRCFLARTSSFLLGLLFVNLLALAYNED